MEVAWRTTLSRALLATLVLQPGLAPPVAGVAGSDAAPGCRPTRTDAPVAPPVLVERVAPDGSLAGYTLRVEGTGALIARVLPPESFASGPFGSTIVVGWDDGTRSRVEAVDVGTGCVTLVLERPEVIRHAVRSGDGSISWFAVDRRTRADLGVWRSRPGHPAERVLPALDTGPPPAAFGRTYSTELALTPAGALVVSSCGVRSCRHRLLPPDAGQPRRFDRPGLGPLIAASDTALLTWAACGGLPCPVVRTRLRDGHRTTVDPAATDVRPAGAGRVRIETSAAGGRRSRIVGLSGEGA